MSARRLRVVGAVLVAALGGGLVSVLPGPADPSSSVAAASATEEAAARAGVDWLETRQQPDGGFEVAAFPGFETPDAVLAIAEAAQSGTTWSSTEARAAVEALRALPSNRTPIDALDDWVGGGINAGEASKLVALVTQPLGLDPRHFGPSDHDLVSIVYPSGCGAPPAAAGLFFLETAFVAIGGKLLCGAADTGVLLTIRAAQRADGGWNYLGDADDVPSPADSDVDTTALAVRALLAGGAPWNDTAVLGGLRFLAGQQSASGAFRAFGVDDPNATAVAVLAIAMAGFDPSSSCWRDTAASAVSAPSYADPLAWLRSQQGPDGRITSPNDAYGVNTFATSQSVQALLWSAPSATAAVANPTECDHEPAPPTTVPPTTVPPTTVPPTTVPPTTGAAPAQPVRVAPRFTG